MARKATSKGKMPPFAAKGSKAMPAKKSGGKKSSGAGGRGAKNC